MIPLQSCAPAIRRTPVVVDQSAPRARTAPTYFPQLDALRAVAVLGVMLHHYWPEAERAIGLSTGFLGVQLFFVLSGFLITGILLRARNEVQAGGTTTGAGILQFYVRRILRIFPLFYATLAIGWVIGLSEIRDSLGWHLLYASNVYMVRMQDWHGSVSHLWSLAVEEQFYLVWPFVIFFTPRRLLLAAFIAVTVLAPAFRLVTALADVHWMAAYALPFGNCDSLAVGGILAYASNSVWANHRYRSALVSTAWWIGVPLVLVMWYLEFNGISSNAISWARTAFENTAWAVFFLWLIDGAARGFGGIVGRVFQLHATTYIGKISYGLYLFHPFIARIIPWAFARAGLQYPQARPLEFVTLSLAAILLATLSWQLYERPITALKERFR